MITIRLILASVAGAAFAAPAVAQVHQIAFERSVSQPAKRVAVDTCVGANTERVIVASNQYTTIFERDGTLKHGLPARIADPSAPGTGLPSANYLPARWIAGGNRLDLRSSRRVRPA